MLTNEEKIAAEIGEIQKLAKDNKDIDVNALVANVIARYQSRNQQLPGSAKTRAYLVSLLLPPFGLYYVVKFLAQDEPAARRVGWICLAMTIVSILLTWSLAGSIFSSLGQIGGIAPSGLQELTQ